MLKNALDWASRPAGQSALTGTPAAVIGASTGMFGAVWAQAETRKVLGALGGRVVEAELPVARAAELYRDGRLDLSPEQSQQLEEILATLVAEVEQLQASPDLAAREARSRSAVGRAKKAIAEKWAIAAAMTKRWKTSW